MNGYIAKNAVEENIMNRRTVKKFTDQPVDPQEIIELLNVAKWGPNHKITEPWRFQLYVGKGKEKFAQAFIDSQPNEGGKPTEKTLRKAQYYKEIPLQLVVIMPEDPRQRTWDEDYGAVCAFIQNFQLAAWQRGIGMVWRTNDWVYSPVFREGIGVKPGEKIVATLMIGYPFHVPEARPRTNIEEFLTIIEE